MPANVTQQQSDSINNSSYDNDKTKNNSNSAKTSTLTIVGFAILAVISVVTLPRPFQPEERPTILHVWYYGWITALSTGLGVIPLLCTSQLDKYWIGVSNGM